jgi:cell division protein FtsI/penicillin-binding protein 2
MGKLKFLSAALAIAAWLTSGGAVLAQSPRFSPVNAGEAGRTLFSQAAAQALAHEFAGDNISYLLLDARTGAVLSSHWPDADRPIPLGSLIKPFTALAYAEHHGYYYPIYVCHGAASGCWQPRPHGRLNIVSAIAYSCNSYFRDMASHLTGDQMQEVADQFGLDLPKESLTGPPLMGLGEEWPIAPLRMAHAYIELVRRRDDPGVRRILTGLRDSAQWGTGSGVGRALKNSDALAKTGTAVCTHEPHAPGDGFVIALLPADQPDLLLMVRVHGVPGATAAVTAGRMLSLLER